MRVAAAFALSIIMTAFLACDSSEQHKVSEGAPGQTAQSEAKKETAPEASSWGSSPAAQKAKIAPSARLAAPTVSGGGGGGGGGRGSTMEVSLAEVSAVQASSIAAEHKIIRNADLIIETDSPSDGMRKVTSIAESQGGFVVTSEFKQNDAHNQSKPSQVVTVVVRVPSFQFGAALESLRGIGGRVLQEKVSGQDVTEEYLDIEARIRTKKALEAQFLEIMKQARKVSDALEVQSELADVRNEIERLEGRRRYLENQSTLSTITITLQMPTPIVAENTPGFAGNIKESFENGVDVATSIVLGLIRLIIILVPVVLLIVLPLAWLLKNVLRRISWPKKPQPVSLNISNE